MEKKKNTPKLRFPEFKGEWEEKKLGEIATLARGKSKHRPRDAEFLYGGKYPFIQTGDIRDAGLYLKAYSQTYSDAGLAQSKLWDENTLCITIAANIAETTILKIKACFPDSIIGLIPIENEANVLFVKAQFDKYKIDIQKLSQGAAQANLNQERLSNLVFSFPALFEQTKIATFLTAVDEKLTQLKKKKTLLEQYKKGVMQKLFSQELRFKDDNNQDFPDWQEKTLGEISKITNGNGDVQDASLEAKDGWYPFYDRSEIVKYLDRYTFDGEAIIYPGEGQSFFPRYFNGKYGLHQRCYTIKDYCANIHGKYLYYYLSTQNNYFIAFAVGSTVPSLRLDTFQQAKVLLPSLVEQQKIATFLSAIDEKISHSSAQIEKMEAWKKGLLQQMFC